MMTNRILSVATILATAASTFPSIHAQLCKVDDLTKSCAFSADFSSGEQQVRLEAALACPVTEDVPNVDAGAIPTAQDQALILEENDDNGCNCAADLINAYDDTLLKDAKTMNCQCFGCPAEYEYAYAFSCESEIVGPCKAFDCEFACNGVAGLQSVEEQEQGPVGTGCPVQENLEKCEELIATNDVPCRCAATDCIAFSNGKFADCVDGTTAFVSGDTASGCTLKDHAPEAFNCTTSNDEIEQSYCGSEPCVVQLPDSCSEMIDTYTFQGSCCSMEDADDGCRLTVADGGNCFWVPKEGECRKEDFNCNIVFTTDAESACPESEFNPLEVGSPSEETVNCGNNNCDVTVPTPCDLLAEIFTFEGSCCSLASNEEYSECTITVANQGSCMWYPNSGDVCDDELKCLTQYMTDSSDACPESEFDVLGGGTGNPDIPEINIECTSAIMLEEESVEQADHSTVDLVTENLQSCGEPAALPGLWYKIFAKKNTTVTVYVCTNNDVVTYFSVFANGCDAQNCLGSPPMQSAPQKCGENPESFSVVAASDGDVFVRVSAGEGEASNFDIWYEVEGGEEVEPVEEVLYLADGDTTIVRNGSLEEEDLGTQDTILVQRSTADGELPSTYALLEFFVDEDEISELDIAGVDFCLERVPRADIFDHTHTYSVCVLDDTPSDDLESLTGELVDLTMPDDCLDGLTVEFDVGPTTDAVQCISITSLLFVLDEDVDVAGSQRKRKLQEGTTIILMIDNLVENDIVGDRWYSLESSDERLAPSLVFVAEDREVDPIFDECFSDGTNAICPAGGTFEVDGQNVIVNADVSCPIEAVEQADSFEAVTQVFGLCTCTMNVGEGDLENPDVEIAQDDNDLQCNCYACPEGSVLEYAYDCGASPVFSTCLQLNCNGTCNGELDNIVFPQVDDPPFGNETETPEKTLPPSTLNPDGSTPAPTPVTTVASTSNSTDEENSAATSRHSFGVWAIAMVVGWLAIA